MTPAVLGLSLIAGSASAQDALGGVRTLLNATQAITVFDYVTASAADGVVTLTGKVTSSAKRDQLETEVATVPGVRQIVNRISVLPASVSDDALRHRVARAIYGHPSFRQYAAMSHPPIRVLVERGRVTLAGQVATSVQRLMALSIAEGDVKGKVGDQLEVSAR
ncbi:MAG: BON domain-containing protein [Vicinamibacterales bacterium]